MNHGRYPVLMSQLLIFFVCMSNFKTFHEAGNKDILHVEKTETVKSF